MAVDRAPLRPMQRLLANRRGLLAGTAALVGAGLARLGGAERAEATHGGAGADVVWGAYNNLGTGLPTVVGDSATNAPALSGANGFYPGQPGATFLVAADGNQGITNKDGGAGVRGMAPDFGVVGQVVRGGAPNSNTAVGVLGQTAFGAAVRGEITSGGNGSGVVGVASACEFGNASNVGVGGSGRGSGGNTGKTGVLGIADNGVAVQGWAIGSGTGIRGSSNFGGGPDFSGSGTGVDGRSGSGIGVFGQSGSNAGVYGQSTSNAAVFGISPYSGVYGISGNIGVWGASTGTGTAVFGQAFGTSGWAGQFAGNVYITGSLTVASGAKSAAVKRKDGSHARVYCQESPEPWFEDFGTATLQNGQASVSLSADFDEVVDGTDYRAFLTEIGDCGGLYVSRKGPHQFEVKSRAGNGATGTFDYRIVAKRAEKVGGRLEKIDLPAALDTSKKPSEPKAVDPKTQQAPAEAQPVQPQPAQGGKPRTP